MVGDINMIYLLYINFVVIIALYFYIFRCRKLIGFQLGMNIAIVAGGMMALISGVLLIFQYPFHFTVITIISTLIGIGVGGLFGALFDYQTFLTGFSNGLMLGLMSPMIGSILTDQFLFIFALEGLIGAAISLIIVSIIRS